VPMALVCVEIICLHIHFTRHNAVLQARSQDLSGSAHLPFR
jgi:hypothetical protein